MAEDKDKDKNPKPQSNNTNNETNSDKPKMPGLVEVRKSLGKGGNNKNNPKK